MLLSTYVAIYTNRVFSYIYLVLHSGQSSDLYFYNCECNIWWTRPEAIPTLHRSVNDFISKKMLENLYTLTALHSPTRAERKWGVCSAQSVCVCVVFNGMHKSGTKQATTWHTDLLLGTFTTRTDVTDWTVCRFSLSHSSPLFFLFFLSLSSQQQQQKPKMTKKIKEEEEELEIFNFSSSFLFHLYYYLVFFLRKLRPTRNRTIINEGFPLLLPSFYLRWFWLEILRTRLTMPFKMTSPSVFAESRFFVIYESKS